MLERTPHQHRRTRRQPDRGTVSTADLIGLPVEDIDGAVIGRIRDIIFEVERGMAAYVVIECDDDHQYALPYEVLRVAYDPVRVSALLQRDVLRGHASGPAHP